jgi:uncharacterized membrane protein YiaA
MKIELQKPTAAFVGASWTAMFIGVGAYLIGLWNSNMLLNEKGFYFVVMLLGLFAAVSLQKSVRDKIENIKVTGIYIAICWVSFAVSLLLLAIGLFNATLELSEKGFYAMSFLLALFSSIAVQKNIRDLALFEDEFPKVESIEVETQETASV